LARTVHPFARVFYLGIVTADEGVIEALFPGGSMLDGFNPVAAAGTRYVNFDPALRQTIKNPDGSIGVGFSLGPDVVKKLHGL
jgi:hypothetical protein